MRLVVHQALKDARLLKWFLAAWVLLNVALHLVVLVGVYQPPPEPREVSVLATVYEVLRALLIAGFIAIPVIAMQGDPGVGTTAFWFTRPIRVRVLLGGKFLLVVPPVVVLPVLLDVCTLWVAGVPPRGTVGPMLEGLALQAAWLLPVMAIAAFTTDLAQFVLGVVLEVPFFIAVWTLVPWALGFAPGNRLFSPGTTPLFLTVLGAASVAVIVLAYLSRSARRSAYAAGAAPVFIAALLFAWPADIHRTFGGSLASPVRIEPRAVWLMPANSAGDCQIAVSLELPGLPATQVVEVVPQEATLVYSDKRVGIRHLYSSAPANARDQAPTAVRALINATQDESGATHESVGAGRAYSFFGTLPASICRDRPRDRATLQVDVRLTAWNYRRAAELPVRSGAAYRIDSGGGEVLDVTRAAYALSLRTREIGLGRVWMGTFSPVWLSSTETLHPVLRGVRAGEVMVPVRSSATVSPFLSISIPVPQHLESTWWTLDFPDADWLQGARLVLVESRRLGTVARDIEIPNIVLSSLPEQGPTR
jgi:hypothetical protein